MNAIQIHPGDTVAVALSPLSGGTSVLGVILTEDIPQGHKFALQDIPSGAAIQKYGLPIGHATRDISAGEHVHTHNVKTNLAEDAVYTYEPVKAAIPAPDGPVPVFQGFRRANGRAGIRNEIWIIPTVGCVNAVAQKIAALTSCEVRGSVSGVYAFPHPYGCSQLGDDHANTRRLLASLCHHPNAGGVLVLGLGCENNAIAGMQEEIGAYDAARLKFLCCQESGNEIEDGAALVRELIAAAADDRREPLPVSQLVVGLKCGGSDGLSGITANPAVGRFSDMLIGFGGSTILTEIPEAFGAETLLMNRAVSREVFDEAVAAVNWFKHYFVSHGQVVYENPSPGNKAGGITTLEDKSCGCIQKSGSMPLVGVLPYGERIRSAGLNLLYGPGNDLVSSTALTAAGANLILFTTGRGTPFGAPAPTVKISTNSALAARKGSWIDFNAGTAAEGESLDSVARRLFDYVIRVANGEQTSTERLGARELAIFKDGVTL